MKKQKIFKSVLSLIVMLSLVVTSISLTAFATDGAAVPLEGNYTFLNVAYSPDADIYVAVAKDLTDTTNTPMKVLVSSNGYSWSVSKTFSSAKTNQNSSSQQILTYWTSQKVFALAVANTLYYSADGASWTSLRAFGNQIVIDSNGNDLFVGWYAKTAVYKSLTQYQDVSLNANQWVSYIIPVQNGALAIQKDVTNGGYRWYISQNVDESGETPVYSYTVTQFNNVKDNYGASVTVLPNGTKAAMSYTDAATVRLITPTDGSRENITVNLSDNTENTSVITATGYANGKMYLGTDDGKIYYTETSSDITNETVWNISENKSSNTESMKAFAQGKNGDAVAVSSKNIFLVYSNYYKNINEYSSVNVPTVTGENIFKGVRLFGGAYAPSKGYVVYGNSSDGQGKVYYSEDGIKWKNVMTTALLFNKDQKGNTFTTDNCIYWENKGLFIINLGGNSVGTCYYSFDGKKWDFSQSIPTATSTGSIGLGQNSNIAVNGDYIYTADPSKNQAYFKTTVTVETDPETNEPKIISHSTESIVGSTSIATAKYGFSFIAVSDETVPYVFLNGGYGVAYGCGGATNTETGRFSFISTNANKLNAAKWDNVLNKFVGVRTDMKKIYVFDKDLSFQALSPSFTDKNIVSFDNNGTKYVFGTSDGSLVSLNSSEITTATTFTNVSAANGVNKLPISSVFAGNNNFIAVATDETNSDVIIVNAAGTQYEKASEKADIVFGEGEKAVVTASAVNNSSSPVNFKMITAIYDGDKLVQTVISDKTIAASFSGDITEEITFNSSVNSNCRMRVYMWDAVNTMTPICEASPFFE